MAAKNRDLKNKAYDIIKDRLINCDYEPGTFLNEAQLATDLGFSRTPVREAIIRLEYENLVTVVPKKGILVQNLTLTDVNQIFQTRLEIEPITLRMSGPFLPKEELLNFREKFATPLSESEIPNGFRLDTAMHLFIIEYCRNRYLIDMMQKIFEDNTRVIISSKQNLVQIHDARQEHIEILDALLIDDFEKAEVLMRTHIGKCRNAAMDYFYNHQAFQPAPQASAYKEVLKKLK